MNLNKTDEEFIVSVRQVCANSIRNTATGNYLNEALERIERLQREKVFLEKRNAILESICASVFHKDWELI